jgi:MFS family permease
MQNSKKITLAYLNSLTFSAIQMVLYTTIPYIAEKTGVTTANIIAAISVGSLIFAFMGPFWAAKSDALGRGKVLSIGMLGMTLSFLLFSALFLLNTSLPLTVKIAMVFAARILYGLLASAVVPVSQAWQLDLIPNEDKLRVLTKNSMCLNLGRILGPILVLAKGVNFEMVIYASTLWLSFLAITVYLLRHSSTPQQGSTDRIELKEVLNRWKENFKESRNPILLALTFTAFIGILHSFLGHHLKTVLNITGQEATLLFAKIILFLSVVAVILQQLSVMVFKSRWQPRVLLGPTSLIVGTIIMMTGNNETSIWIAIAFIAVATAFIPPVYLSLTSESRHNSEKTNIFGKKLGLASVAHSLGYALGAGLIALSLKLHLVSNAFVVFLISFLIAVVSISLFKVYDRDGKRKHA